MWRITAGSQGPACSQAQRGRLNERNTSRQHSAIPAGSLSDASENQKTEGASLSKVTAPFLSQQEFSIAPGTSYVGSVIFQPADVEIVMRRKSCPNPNRSTVFWGCLSLHLQSSTLQTWTPTYISTSPCVYS